MTLEKVVEALKVLHKHDTLLYVPGSANESSLTTYQFIATGVRLWQTPPEPPSGGFSGHVLCVL